MAEDDQDRAREAEAEREAEITSEMERIGQDPDQVQEGSDTLGTQNAESGGSGDGEVRRTTDPTLLRSVIEERGGYPAHVPESEGEGDRGLLRIGFRDREEDLTEVSWETFEEEVQEKDLVGIYTEDGSDVDGGRPVELRSREDD